mmetsp:Transcript_10304/g.20247  ORF Transcript_10304/g.20247 Transcript_10304/m.20247 type:complete len:259 (+) Transcript_10304:363-1139(+)
MGGMCVVSELRAGVPILWILSVLRPSWQSFLRNSLDFPSTSWRPSLAMRTASGRQFSDVSNNLRNPRSRTSARPFASTDGSDTTRNMITGTATSPVPSANLRPRMLHGPLSVHLTTPPLTTQHQVMSFLSEPLLHRTRTLRSSRLLSLLERCLVTLSQSRQQVAPYVYSFLQDLLQDLKSSLSCLDNRLSLCSLSKLPATALLSLLLVELSAADLLEAPLELRVMVESSLGSLVHHRGRQRQTLRIHHTQSLHMLQHL